MEAFDLVKMAWTFTPEREAGPRTVGCTASKEHTIGANQVIT